jgi:glycerate 2-kinase
MISILVASDKFKGSLSAVEVCYAVKQGLLDSGIQHTLTMIPMADGGEGTCDLLTHYHKGIKHITEVNGPLFTPVRAAYGISGDGTTAFIEMAQASGMQLTDRKNRDPLSTSTFGTGELICKAIEHGVDTIILGIGGSATNDAGIGMAAALGYEFFDGANNSLKPVGRNLIHLRSISNKNVLPGLQKIKFVVLCDVANPLHGSQGAAYVYGPQKGAASGDLPLLDFGLKNFETVASHFFPMPVNFPGAGAAGGLGAGAKVFLHATLHRGMDYITETTGLIKKIQAANSVITGEGKLDEQSLSGKVVMEVSRLALQMQKPVIVICGKNELPDSVTKSMGIDTVLSLTAENIPEEEAMREASTLIKEKITRHFADL